jgi:hypothetical protein
MSETDDGLGFAAEHDVPVPYMRRTRDYYLALGYENPYRWAQFAEVPFAALAKPLSGSRLALVTSAAPVDPAKGDQGPGAAYNAAAKFYRVYAASVDAAPPLGISHLGYDRTHTTAADPRTYFPLAALRDAAAAGRIGEVSPRFHGAPTNRSQRQTMEQDCPELLANLREDMADIALLVPN